MSRLQQWLKGLNIAAVPVLVITQIKQLKVSHLMATWCTDIFKAVAGGAGPYRLTGKGGLSP